MHETPDTEHAIDEAGLARMESTLRAALETWKLELPESAWEQFCVYTRELLGWNAVMNLTAIVAPEEIALKHFADSLAVLKFAPPPCGAKLADVGCGAGFPGVPLKLARPDLSLACMDGQNKRVTFLRALSEKLGAEFACVHARAEEAGRQAAFRETFDLVTARAVADLQTLCEYCLPFVKPGGAFLALKGAEMGEELARARRAVSLLGAETESVVPYALPGSGDGRTLVVLRKIAPTPGAYPRASAKIAKAPL